MDVAPNTEADPIALGSPQTKYRLVFGKVQAPLQERTSKEVRESGREIWGGAIPDRRCGREGSATSRTQPLSTQSRRELRGPALANLRRIRANAALRPRMIPDTLMSNAKTKSFHGAMRGNPAARDLAEPNTYTTPRRERSINHRQSINDKRSTDNQPT